MRLHPVRVLVALSLVGSIVLGSSAAASATPLHTTKSVEPTSRVETNGRAAGEKVAQGVGANIAATHTALNATIPAAAAPSAPSTPGAAGGIGISLQVPAGTAGQDPRAKAYIVDRVAPGSTIHRTILVQNTTSVRQSVRVYTGSSQIVAGNFIGDRDPSSNLLTDWTTLASGAFDLAPGQATTDLVTIVVPTDAAEQELYAAVWAEIRLASGDGSGVVQANRVGIRMYLSVGAGNGAPSDFSIGAVSVDRSADGAPVITTALTNTGGRALDISGSGTLHDGPGAMSSGPFSTASALTLAPATSGKTHITLPAEIPNGKWSVTLTFTSGLVVHEKTVVFTLAELAQPQTGWLPITFWWILLLLLVIILLSAISVYYRRRQRSTAEQATPTGYAEGLPLHAPPVIVAQT